MTTCEMCFPQESQSKEQFHPTLLAALSDELRRLLASFAQADVKMPGITFEERNRGALSNASKSEIFFSVLSSGAYPIKRPF